MWKEFIIRIGTFFILIGAGIFILFIASEAAGKTNFDYLCAAVACVTVGVMFQRRKPPNPPSERFGYVRKLREQKHPSKER